MSDMMTPLQSTAPSADTQRAKPSPSPSAAGNPTSDSRAQGGAGQNSLATGYAWPTLPFAAYSAQTEQRLPQACEIVGLNGVQRQGRLISFLPDQAVAQIDIPPARTTIEIRFAQFKALTLTELLKPTLPSALIHTLPYSRIDRESATA